MVKDQNLKQYDLEERTLAFASRTVKLCKALPRTVVDAELAKQLVRASTSVGANYIEANEALSKKDFLMRIKISRKEAKESTYWLKLIEPVAVDLRDEHQALLQESVELMKIFGSIIAKAQ